MFVLNGKVLTIGEPFNHKGLQYPGDWLAQSTQEQRDAIGIATREAPKVRQIKFDRRFWFGIDQPRELGEVKVAFLKKHSTIVSRILASTDWYYVRRLDTGAPVPDHVVSYRDDVRKVHVVNEGLITKTESIEELEELINNGMQPYPEQE